VVAAAKNGDRIMQHAITSAERGFKRAALPLPPGNSFVRLLTAKVISRVRGEPIREVAARIWPDDRVVNEFLTRAASAPAMVSTPSWAGALAHTIVADAVTALSAASAGAKVLSQGLLLTWDGAGAIAVPTFVAGAGNASFVKEGDPIPVRQLSVTDTFLTPYKLATISALTREMVESSNAEALIEDTLVKSAGLALDAALFGTAASSAAAPAGLLYNIATLPPSANADPFGAVFEDVTALIGVVSVVGGTGPYFIIGSAANIIGMLMRFDIEQPTEQSLGAGPLRPIISGGVGPNLIAVAAQAVAAVMDPIPDLDIVKAGTLVMDTAPGAAGTMGTEKSLFQTDSLAIKMRWPVSWTLRDPRGAAWTTPAWK
jgi:Phage capsid family